ncbi:hypothetical protein GLI01_24510 [Gluconacetobacter liquefaciens]|uniref:Uncharacterized protein n=1 Tax=Gluconacetobacter liquefaciens TaxID=89584 RepID=A0A7W4JMC5_GLULI|nr:hypothetical protein [Gluconacetobacter liquefaciens]MBB2187190.1 hypothetical protein [Gluconacetobacter liquefaciens]GBR00849.1 hypothetical protein AA0522_1447 [Gluconacetobacter liquefaciens NRIC 0522]GEB38416.1 hypothetical protein GLI01_24510 [Gluconacetobacter liquefaciens]
MPGTTSNPTVAPLKASCASVSDGSGVTTDMAVPGMAAWRARHRSSRDRRSVGGGPEWFTQRPDDASHCMIAQRMDLPPEGAVGGNVFENVRMTLDGPYARAAAWNGHLGRSGGWKIPLARFAQYRSVMAMRGIRRPCGPGLWPDSRIARSFRRIAGGAASPECWMRPVWIFG